MTLLSGLSSKYVSILLIPMSGIALFFMRDLLITRHKKKYRALVTLQAKGSTCHSQELHTDLVLVIATPASALTFMIWNYTTSVLYRLGFQRERTILPIRLSTYDKSYLGIGKGRINGPENAGLEAASGEIGFDTG